MLSQTPNIVPTATEKVPAFLQRVVNDLKRAIGGGLTIQENLPFAIRTVQVRSGVPFVIADSGLRKLYGASLVLTEGATVQSVVSTITQQGVSLTVVCTPDTANLSFMLVGESTVGEQ